MFLTYYIVPYMEIQNERESTEQYFFCIYLCDYSMTGKMQLSPRPFTHCLVVLGAHIQTTLHTNKLGGGGEPECFRYVMKKQNFRLRRAELLRKTAELKIIIFFSKCCLLVAKQIKSRFRS